MYRDIFDFEPPVVIERGETAEDDMLWLEPIPFDLTMMKGPFSTPPFPPTFFAPIGAVLVQWGGFESKFDLVLESLVRANGTQEEQIARGFKRKCKRFRHESRTFFECNPALLQVALKIVELGAVHYQRRNLLAHGAMECHLHYDRGSERLEKKHVIVQIRASGYVGNQPIKEHFSMGQLKWLFYFYGSISGMIDLFIDDAVVNLSPFSSDDKSFLLDWIRKDRPNRPTH